MWNELKSYLAYIIYLKMYGLTDEPFEQGEVSLSQDNNDWNSLALLDSQKTWLVEELPQEDKATVSMSEKDNQWNKEAISYE